MVDKESTVREIGELPRLGRRRLLDFSRPRTGGVRDMRDGRLPAFVGAAILMLALLPLAQAAPLRQPPPNAKFVFGAVAASEPERKPASKKWLAALGIMGLLVLSTFGGFLAVRRLRRPGNSLSSDPALEEESQAKTAAPTISLSCPDCDKSLKVKATLAGKKIKCPQCSTLAQVPQVESTARRETRVSAWTMGLAALLGLLGVVVVLLSVWLFWPSNASPPPSFLNVLLGPRYVPGVEETGFYDDEEDEQSRPFRWTNGRGRLEIPLDKSDLPRAMFVKVQRPIGSWLRITVNDRELIDEKANERDMIWWERTLDLNSIDLGEKLVVEIVSNTVVPRVQQPGKSDDGRSLGVTVREIKLLRQADKEELALGSGSFLDVTVGHRFVSSVEDSGFYHDEREKERWFRWTNGKAKVVIPLNKTAPRPQALEVRLQVPRNISLQIVVNRRTLVNEPPNKQRALGWDRTLDLNGIDLGEAIEVEILSSTTKASPPSTDTRPLGVRVYGIKLRRENKGENVSADR